MPILNKTKPTIDPDAVYVAWQSFAHRSDVIQEGDRLRGSSPVVQEVPHLFALDGTPASEMPSVWDTVLEETVKAGEEKRQAQIAEFEAVARLNKVKLDVDVVTCKTEHYGHVGGFPATIAKGSKALATDPVVVSSPEHWS